MTTYDTISRFNHWLTAGVIIGMLALGLFLENVDLARETRGPILALHKALGALFLVFAVWRVGYRIKQSFPKTVANLSPWQDIAAKAVHWLLLAGILIMPVSGLMMSLFGGHDVNVFGLLTIPAFEKNETLFGIGHVAHGIGGNVLLAAIALHILAALKHHVFDKDLTLVRMLGTRRTKRTA